jgi:hypothetical protein
MEILFNDIRYAFRIIQKSPFARRSMRNVVCTNDASTRMIANQDGSVYSTRCSAAYAVYREDQWQRRSRHTELES